ncbi:MAG: SagB/ThcOx family dehydrogenase [Desulfobulbus sp.]|nr:SagB/ThcOx family dehydrogenase [Desulfobulbus sp.]
MPETAESKEFVRQYHLRTKHHFERYAPGPDRLDWAIEPVSFRRFIGTPYTRLPMWAADLRTVRYADLFQAGGIVPEPIEKESVGVLLELSFGLSDWISSGRFSRPLRCTPSSGNLHPTEISIALSGVAGIPDGVHHYSSLHHVLEQRCSVTLPLPGALVGLSSVHWREAWKYGERAFRYCQLDIGHGFAALRFAAAVLGWHVRLLDCWSDADIALFLGLDRQEDFVLADPEAPGLICRVGPETEQTIMPDPLLSAVTGGQWYGQVDNRSSVPHPEKWAVIDEVRLATEKPRTELQEISAGRPASSSAVTSDRTAAALIRQRRSVRTFDRTGTISAKTLWRLLDATLPRPDEPPFDAWPYPPRIHLLLFLHRVEGVAPGLFLLPREKTAVGTLRTLMRSDFLWTVEQESGPVCLYRLLNGDCRQLATAISCYQEMAGNSALSAGMLAQFDAALEEGSWMYRRLFWEAGMIGQVLYLEAEAAGLRGTGIGCFFDDAVHELCGLQGTACQSLYHFTLGPALNSPEP